MATSVSAYNFPKFIAVCSEIVEGQKVETNLKDLIEKFLCVASLLENDDKRKGTIFYALLAACRVITRSEEALVTLGHCLTNATISPACWEPAIKQDSACFMAPLQQRGKTYSKDPNTGPTKVRKMDPHPGKSGNLYRPKQRLCSK